MQWEVVIVRIADGRDMMIEGRIFLRSMYKKVEAVGWRWEEEIRGRKEVNPSYRIELSADDYDGRLCLREFL